MPLCFSLHTHKCSLSLSLSGEKHYKRESFQWAILSGEGDPNFGERKNLRIIANEARDALMGRRWRWVPRGFLIWLTCILILSTFIESGGWKREKEKYEYSSSFIFQGISNPTGGWCWFWPISIPITEMTAFTPGPWQRSGPVHRRSGEEGVGACSQLSTNTH